MKKESRKYGTGQKSNKKQSLKRTVCCVLCMLLMFSAMGISLAEQYSKGTIENFSTTDINGNTVELKDILSASKITMINVGATWCIYCEWEVPDLEEISHHLAEEDCNLICIMLDATDEESIAAWKQILDSYGANYQHLLPTDNFEAIFPKIEAYPTTFYVDSEGNILDTIVGAAVDLYEPIAEGLLQLYINTADKILPGSTVQFSVTGITDERTFTWSVEGKDAKIDETTGALTIPESAEIGTEYIVTARSDQGEEITAAVYVNDGLMSGGVFSGMSRIGYMLPHLISDGWVSHSSRYYTVCDTYGTEENVQARGQVYAISNADVPGGFAENPDVAKEYLLAAVIPQENEKYQNVQFEMIEIDGHPAVLYTYDIYQDGTFRSHLGCIDYPRNTTELFYQLLSYAPEGGTPESTPTVTMTDLKELASRIQYDESKAIFTRENATFAIAAKGEPASVTAGKNIQFKAEFTDTENINKKNKNDGVTWTVTNADSGAELSGITISDKGQLKVDKTLGAPVNLLVKAVSPIYETKAEYRLSANPIIKGIVLEPTEVFFYTGVEAEQTVKATLDPSSVPPKGIIWSPKKEGVVDIAEVEDGKISLKPVGSGKISIEVKEPSGKKANLNISIVDPVTGLELTATGKTVPGGTVNVKAALEPKNAGNKNLEWSVNVGENVATINAKGQVKISKTAPVGTKIAVTCKALGAPEPVVSTIDLEVAEK